VLSNPQERPDGGVLRRLARTFTESGQELNTSDSTPTRPVYDTIARLAVEQVDGARAASITVYHSGRFATVAATDERARQADALQYELGSGPCIDAILHHSLYRPADLRRDDRWPDFGARVSERVGWLSMLSYRMSTEITDEGVLAGLNVYSDQPNAFHDQAIEAGLLLATHGATVVAAQTNLRRAKHLRHALETSRDIGIAIGILMKDQNLTREQAFDLLRIASQHTNRRLNDIAHEVADTATLPYQPFQSHPATRQTISQSGREPQRPATVDKLAGLTATRQKDLGSNDQRRSFGRYSQQVKNAPLDPLLVEAFTEIAQTFEAEPTPQAMLWAITRAAAKTVPRCAQAGVLMIRAGQVVGATSSNSVTDVVGHLQQRVGEGPCLEAIRERPTIVIDDLDSDPRWPLFARSAAEETGMRSMLSLRLLVEPNSHSSLNLYSRDPKAFDDNAHAKGAILAVLAKIALAATRDRETTEHLRNALDSNREIGVAMGILMARGNLTRPDAFSVLRGASQRLNIKLRRIAAQVVQSGALNEEDFLSRADQP
jgi:AmiR/NasT family two-component response regulator